MKPLLGQSLSKRLRYSLFPTALRLQYEFNNLACSTMSSRPMCCEMANRGQLGCAVGYTHPQSGSACQRNVGKIVAQIGNFPFGHASLLHALFESLRLLRLPKDKRT